ncbi:hypothetical protein [Thermotalea metallivorans]|uniref:Uncharacterized protein n=1 Tax=Thermotalea metallivorans TaxID=520762 RepID=A0A140L154_9FIRM|nr:hypothetical protein [Thermotalea metallivorans]KXG74279.1 hypothetical protein AN619_24710 [Thermotalea metallivorans]
MKKIVISLILILAMLSNVAMALESTYSTFDASILQNAFPHTVSKDGKLIVEGKLTATDYASILFALSNIQDNNENIKNRIANTYTSYILTSEFLFLKPDGSVLPAYDHKDGKFVPNTKLDIASVAQFSAAFYDALQNRDKFNANPWYTETSQQKALKHAQSTSKYVLGHLYESGKFYNEPSKATIDIKSMGNGLLAFNALWNLEKDTAHRQHYIAVSKEIYDFMAASWNGAYGVYAFDGNSDKVKFDLRDFGLFLWGSKELAQILAEGGYGYEALEIMKNTHKMLTTALVKDVTYKPEGIVREIQIDKGVAQATKDEINTGRLYTFLYGLEKWNESPFATLIGIRNQNIHFIKDMVIYSIRNHMDDYGLIHDTKFSDVSVKNGAKETPYLAWYMVAADYVLENYTKFLTDAEYALIEKSIQQNYDFLMNSIYMSGKKLNAMSGF